MILNKGYEDEEEERSEGINKVLGITSKFFDLETE